MSVLINGCPSRKFKAEIGLPQGDPISPLLFIIAAEGIAGLLRNAPPSSCFTPFSVVDNLCFDLLQYVDDTIIIGNACWENICTIKADLKGFELASGLRVNFHKSKILGFNVKHDFLQVTSNFP